MFFPKREPRQFKFTPYYYQMAAEQEEPENDHRIKFRRLSRRQRPGKKPVVRLLLIAVLLAFFLFYFWGTVEKSARTFKIEDIRIEAPVN